LLRTFSIAFKKAISSTSTAITAAAMGVASMLQIDEMLGDFNRMNKRQVSSAASPGNAPIYHPDSCPFPPAVAVPGAELRHDRLLGADDLEGPDGGHRQRVADRCRAQWQHGAGFPPRRPPLPH